MNHGYLMYVDSNDKQK